MIKWEQKSKLKKKSLDQKKDFPKSLEPELNTEQPNFRPLIFSQPENKNQPALPTLQSNIQKYLQVISKKKPNPQSPRNFMIISP